jgi:hypothetical protein
MLTAVTEIGLGMMLGVPPCVIRCYMCSSILLTAILMCLPGKVGKAIRRLAFAIARLIFRRLLRFLEGHGKRTDSRRNR